MYVVSFIGFEDRFTDSSDPKMWTHWQVQCWLKQLSEKLAVGVDLNIFLDLNGESLCQMTMEDFINRDHTVGGMVYNELQQLQYSQTTYPYVSQNNYYPNFPTDFRGEYTKHRSIKLHHHVCSYIMKLLLYFRW